MRIDGHGGTVEWYQDEGRLVVPLNAPPLELCVRCGSPTEGTGKDHTFHWHSPWGYYALFMGVIPYALLIVWGQRDCSVFVPTCQRHLGREKTLRYTAIGVLVGAIPFSIALGELGGGSGHLAVFVAMLLLAVGVVLLSRSGTPLRPLYINDEMIVFRCAGKEFLSSLAPCPPEIVAKLVWPTISRWISMGVAALITLGIIVFVVSIATGNV